MRGRDVILALAFALTASGCGAPRDSAKQLVKEAGRIGARSWPQAVQLYAGALQKNPHLAGAYLGLSIAEERSGPGYYSLAAHAAREGIALAPKDYRLYQQLADVEYNQDKYEQATADEMKSVALVPRAADAYSGIADKLTDLKQWDAAIVVVGRMIALDPNSAEYYIRRGTLYTSEGAYSRAHGDFAQALRLSHSKATSALGYSQDALASLKQNEIVHAERAIAASLASDPGCYSCAMAGTAIYAAALLPRKMLAVADDAVRDAVTPMDQAWARKARADAYLRLGQRRDAYSDYRWIMANTADATLNNIVGGIVSRLQLNKA